MQKVLCKYILIPELTKSLIYDNYASLKNRGTSFARKRIDVMLRRFIRKHGGNGYILQIDIKRFFDNIDHDILKEMLHRRLKEPTQIMNLIDYMVDSSSKTNKGLNLGSEAPQIFAIYYLSEFDNYLKSVRSVKYYGRYMDDMFVLSEDKDYLKELLSDIKSELEKIGLEINTKKTRITKLSHGFTFMQIKYHVDNGKIIKRPTRRKITAERRRLKGYKRQYDIGKMNEMQISNCYKSWKNSLIKDCNSCTKTINSMDLLYFELFSSKEVYKKQTREQILKNTFIKDG